MTVSSTRCHANWKFLQPPAPRGKSQGIEEKHVSCLDMFVYVIRPRCVYFTYINILYDLLMHALYIYHTCTTYLFCIYYTSMVPHDGWGSFLESQMDIIFSRILPKSALLVFRDFECRTTWHNLQLVLSLGDFAQKNNSYPSSTPFPSLLRQHWCEIDSTWGQDRAMSLFINDAAVCACACAGVCECVGVKKISDMHTL